MNCLMNCTLLRYNMRLLHFSRTFANIAKTMKKVMNKTSSQHKKFKYYESSGSHNPVAFSKGLFEGRQSHNSKRANVLNKLFMRYITDLMSLGECSSYFVGHGIEVSRVQVSPDFTSVNIYWIARGTEKDNVIDEILQTHVGALRHELAQLKIVGVIPKLQFVKDKQYAIIAEIDRLLAIADFGDDHVPLDISTRLTAQLDLKTTLDPQVINKIQSLENSDCEKDVDDEPVPPMSQNVFNLNHLEIMENIMKSKRKSQAPQKMAPESGLVPSINENAITFANAQEERTAFRNFLNKRQILKDKSLKPEKNYQPELEYLRQEFLEQQKLDDYFIDTYEERDYLDEEDKK